MSEATAVPAQQPGTAPTDPAATPPVVPPTPASIDLTPPAAPLIPDPEAGVVVEYTPTGDDGLDLALSFIGKLGYGPERPEIKAATKGDFAPLEASLKTLGDKAKGFERYISVAKASYGRTVAAREDGEAKVTAAIVEAAGGVPEWNALQAWVTATADDSEKAEITAAFKLGKGPAQAMVMHLANLYRQSGQSTAKPASVVQPTASKAGADASGELTKSGFQDGVRELRKKFGNRLEETPEYAALSQRRLAAIRNNR